MIGQSTERAPHASVVLPHFAFSTLSFVVLAVLVLLASNELLGHYFQGKMLALTHVATLGWITMVIFGALYQLIPVVLEVSLYSERLAKVNFGIFALGILGLVPAFWFNKFGWQLLLPSGLLLVAFSLFSLNVGITALRAKKWSLEARFIVASVFWFLVTGLIGFLLSLNFSYPFLTVSHLEVLKAHAHLGLIGWFVLLIIGVGSVLIPMFLLSHKMNKNKLQLAFWATQPGLAIYAVDHIWGSGRFDLLALALVAVGVFGFLAFIWESYRKRARKKLDLGLKHTAVALGLMLLPLPLAAIQHFGLGIDSSLLLRVSTLYGASFLIGFISSLILGQYYKTLPFIIWLWRYQPYVGKFRTPLPKELYSEALLKWQYYAYNASILFLFAGVATGWQALFLPGAVLLLATSLLFSLNVLKMYLHKVQLKEF